MGINDLFTKIKLYLKIFYGILILIYETPKKIIILIRFNKIDHIKSKNKNYTNY